MAGALTISTLNNDAGVLATQNGMTGIAKAWVNFNGTGTVAIRASMNVSSITDNGTGDYTVNFTTAMPNANYSMVASGTCSGGVAVVCGVFSNGSRTVQAPTTTSARFISLYNPASQFLDAEYLCVSVFSS
jgi:hypothetical protein